ncbi:MAG: hypothetical protein R2795_02815 [Saprospiraceae bacterium]
MAKQRCLLLIYHQELYNLSITDDFGCTWPFSFALEEAILPQLSGEVSSTGCLEPTGAITVIANPPGDYMYSWSDVITNYCNEKWACIWDLYRFRH